MQDSGNNNLSMTVITILLVVLIILITAQWLWLNRYLKKQRSIEKAQRGRYIHYYVGRGGTGFVGVHKHSLTIFKDEKNSLKIPYEELYIYRTHNRFDFKRGPEPLTMMDKTYGVVLSVAEMKQFKKFIEENDLKLIKIR